LKAGGLACMSSSRDDSESVDEDGLL
jgi:hypothetical protein